MKHFNKLKKELRNESQQLPQGFEWDEMKDGIFDNLDLNTRVATKSMIISLLSIGVILLSVLLYNSYSTSTEENSSIDSQTVDSSKPQNHQIQHSFKNNTTDSFNQSKGKTFIKEENQQHNPGEGLGVNTSLSTNNTQNVVSSSKKPQEKYNSTFHSVNTEIVTKHREDQFNNELTRNVTINTVKKKDIINGQDIVAKQLISSQPIHITSNQSINPDNKEMITSSAPNNITNQGSNESFQIDKMLNEQTILRSLNELQKIPTIERQTFVVSKLKFNEVFYSTSEIINSTKNCRKDISLSIGGGINLWSNTSSQLNTAFDKSSNIIGNTASVHLQYPLSSKFGLSIGLNSKALRTKYENTNSTLENRFLEDAFIGHSVNPASGIQSEVHRDTFVVDTITQYVVHHNAFRTISLPLIVNYTLQSIGWKIGIGLGPSFEFLVNYEGKYSNENDILDFDQAANQFDQKFGISLKSNVFIEKQIVNNWSIGTNVSFSKGLSDFSSSEQFSLQTNVLSNEIYVKYTF